MATGDVWKMALVGRVGIDDVVVTHHFIQMEDVADPALEGQQLLACWEADCKDAFLALCCGDYALDYITAKNRTANTDEAMMAIDENGAQSGESMPNNIATLVSLRTGLAGRSNRGRNYLPPMSKGNTLGNNIINIMLTTTQAYYSALDILEGAPDGVWKLAVYSAKNNVARPVTAALVRTQLGGQDRRKPGHGS